MRGDKMCRIMFPEVNEVAAVLLVLARVAVILRLVSRELSSARPGFDDFVILLVS